jgi:hypothetical protein
MNGAREREKERLIHDIYDSSHNNGNRGGEFKFLDSLSFFRALKKVFNVELAVAINKGIIRIFLRALSFVRCTQY